MGGPTFHAFYTLVVFGVIILVILWAYSRRNKDKFDHDANSIFDEEKVNKDAGQNQKRESKNDE